MEGQEDEKIIVQSLIGGSQLPFYLRCLKSLVTFCQDRIDLQLHTDGSLSQEDKDFIHSELDGTKQEKVSSRVLIRDSMNFRQPSYGSNYNTLRMIMPNAEQSHLGTIKRFKIYPLPYPPYLKTSSMRCIFM